MIMQTQNFILKSLQKVMSGAQEPPETLEYLSHGTPQVDAYEGNLSDHEALKTWFEERACALAYGAATAMMKDPSKAQQVFSQLQPFDLRDVCEGYYEQFIINTFMTTFLPRLTNAATKAVFVKILLLFMQNRLIKHKIYPGGSDELLKLKESVLGLVSDLRKEIVTLTDVLPFPNEQLGALGNEDLEYVPRYYEHIMSESGVTERAKWWKLMYQNQNVE